MLSVLGIYATAGIALPFVNVLKDFKTSELMLVRGGITVLFIGLFLNKKIVRPNKGIIGFSILFALANFSLYNGIRAWGANPTIVIVTMTPFVNIMARWWKERQVNTAALVSLVILLFGVIMALEPWNVVVSPVGVFWSVAATLLAGAGFEVLSTTKKINPNARGFWLSTVVLVVGATVCTVQGSLPFTSMSISLSKALVITAFGLIGGFLYFMANIIAFDHLDTEVASVLAMGETPAVILGAGILLNEQMSAVQWLGVLIALGATVLLSYSEARNKSSATQGA